MKTSKYFFFSIILIALFLGLQACDSNDKPAPNRKVHKEEKKEPHRNFLIFDRGTISVNTVQNESASIAPLIYAFDEQNNFHKDILKVRNPYAKWGFIANLHLTADGKQLLLCSSRERITAKNSPSDPGFNPDGRLSVLDAVTLEMVKQIDFPAFNAEDNSYPSELFAFDDKVIYLHYSMAKTYKVDLTKPYDEMKSEHITSLDGRSLSRAHIYNGKAYLLDKTEYGAYDLLAFDPKDESFKSINVGKPYHLISGYGDLLYFSYPNGGISIYSLSKGAFELRPMTFDSSFGAVYSVVWDKAGDQLYLTFNEEHVRPYIYTIKFSVATSDATVQHKPEKFAKLEMLTSDIFSGKARLYIDPHQDKLFATYFHSDRYNRGGMVNIYPLRAVKNGELTPHEKSYQIGQLMTEPYVAFSIPKTNK